MHVEFGIKLIAVKLGLGPRSSQLVMTSNGVGFIFFSFFLFKLDMNVWFCMHHLHLEDHIVEVCALQAQHIASVNLKLQPPPQLD